MGKIELISVADEQKMQRFDLFCNRTLKAIDLTKISNATIVMWSFNSVFEKVEAINEKEFFYIRVCQYDGSKLEQIVAIGMNHIVNIEQVRQQFEDANINDVVINAMIAELTDETTVLRLAKTNTDIALRYLRVCRPVDRFISLKEQFEGVLFKHASVVSVCDEEVQPDKGYRFNAFIYESMIN